MPARNLHQRCPQLIATTNTSHKEFGNSTSLDSSSSHSTMSVGRSKGKEEEKKKKDSNDKCRRKKQSKDNSHCNDTTDDRRSSRPNNKPRKGILMTLERKTSERSLASFILERKTSDRSLASFTSTKSDDEKVVEFRSTVRVRRIPSHRQFSSEERSASWYDSNEIEQRDASVKSIVKKLSSISTTVDNTTVVNNGNNDIYRGLEHRLHTEKNKARSRRKSAILRHVLDEQENMHRNNWSKKQQQLENAYNNSINSDIIIDIDGIIDIKDDDDENNTSHDVIGLAEVYTSCNWNDRVEARKRGIEDALASED
jgi:hypothetical protein